MSTSDETDGETATPTTAREAIDHIEARTKALRDEEIARALVTLDERGDLTPKKRVVVAALADRLTSQLVEPPKAALRAAQNDEESRTVRVACDLFGE